MTCRLQTPCIRVCPLRHPGHDRPASYQWFPWCAKVLRLHNPAVGAMSVGSTGRSSWVRDRESFPVRLVL